MGSVAEHVAQEAPVPVLIIKSHPDGHGGLMAVPPSFRHLVVGYDDRRGAENALHFAQDVARHFGSRITLVRAVEPQEIDSARSHLEQACAMHLPDSAAWEKVVVPGCPCDVLTGIAQDPDDDTIIVGPHEFTRWGHCSSDSPVGILTRKAPCAVLAMH
jgi:nucleotide-binding universal stress UspA family protein